MNSTIKNIIIIVLIIGACVVLYNVFLKKDTAPELVSTTGVRPAGEVQGASTDTAGKDFLSTLLNLKTLKLSGEIFENTAFKRLEDFSKDLTKGEPEGRPNPFAPIGNDVGTVGVIGGAQTTTGVESTPEVIPEVPETPAQTVITGAVTVVKGTTATLQASTSIVGGTKGFEIGKTTPPTLLVTSSIVPGQNGAFTLPITALSKNTQYYIRAVVTLNGVPTKGDIVTFTTLAN